MIPSVLLDTIAFTTIDDLAIKAIFFMVLFILLFGIYVRYGRP